VILLANTHGEYLGAPEHEALFAELDRRRAIVFVHPDVLPGPSVPGCPPFAPTSCSTRRAPPIASCRAACRAGSRT
jgi:hypothetical protein